MKKAVVAVASALAAGAVGLVIWFFAVGGNEPSTDVTAPALASTTTSTEASTTTTGSVTTTGVPSTTEAGAITLFEIGDGSTATFVLDEELRGRATTVEGVSSIVLGQIEIDRDELANTRVGEVLVNARDFTTGSSNRNRAVNGPILDTGAHEFVSFVPTRIDGLSGPASVGEQLSFTVTGDLTIRDVTNTVTFDVAATLTGEGTLEGSASTTVSRSEFELSIPSAPGVANVSDEVALRLDFEASPAS